MGPEELFLNVKHSKFNENCVHAYIQSDSKQTFGVGFEMIEENKSSRQNLLHGKT